MDAMGKWVERQLREAGEIEESQKDCYRELKMTAEFLLKKKGTGNDKEVLDEEFVTEQLTIIEDAVKSLIGKVTTLRAWQQVLREVAADDKLQTRLSEAAKEDEGMLPDLSAELQARVAAALAKGGQGEKVQDHRYFKEICKIIHGRLPGEEDDELEVMTTQDQEGHALKCPITKALFADPVKNTSCGHTFSRAAIQQMLRSGNRGQQGIRCPVPGCNQVVKSSTLEEDKEKAKLVRRYEVETQLAGQTQHGENVHDVEG